MANTGVRSRGCRTCIARKVRCDRQRPVCAQCQKGNRQCEGYRDEVDLVFRNQTSSVVAKVQAERKTSRAPRRAARRGPPRESPQSESSENRTASAPTDIAISRSPKLNEESGLRVFFANNFTCSTPLDSGWRSNLFWVPSDFDDILKNPILDLSMQSVGAMALARLRGSSHYLRHAQKKYGTALLALADIWRQPDRASNEAAMYAMLFLAFFEVLASEASSRQGWMTHVAGLGALFNQPTALGVRPKSASYIFFHSRNQAILNALQTGTSVTEAFVRASHAIRKKIPGHLSHVDEADMLRIRLASLQADLRKSGPSEDLLASLNELEAELCQWPSTIPPPWSFCAQADKHPTGPWWGVRRDVYPSPIASNIWNNHRAARIIVGDLIHETSLRLSSLALDDVNNKAVPRTVVPDEDIRQLVIEICATIPAIYRPSDSGSDGTQDPPLLGNIYFLLWPLEIVGSMRDAPVELTDWIRLCFERMYEFTGILKAKVAADRLRLRQSTLSARASSCEF